jgi:MFS family permease
MFDFFSDSTFCISITILFFYVQHKNNTFIKNDKKYIGVISGAMLPIRKYYNLTHTQQEITVSCTVLAAFFSSIIGGTINTKYGRRYTIQLASIIFTIGSLFLFISWNYTSLLIGRTIVGIGIGLASLTTPIYIAEVATPSLRGKLVTVNAFMVYVFFPFRVLCVQLVYVCDFFLSSVSPLLKSSIQSLYNDSIPLNAIFLFFV